MTSLRTERRKIRSLTPERGKRHLYHAFRSFPIPTQLYFPWILVFSCGPGSSVGIATDYGLDGPGIESRWDRDFPFVQTSPGAHPAYCKMGTGSFPEVKSGRGVLLTTHPLLAPRSWKSTAIPLPPLWTTTGPVTGLLTNTLYDYAIIHY